MLPRLNPRHRMLTVICVGITAFVAILYWGQWFFGGTEQATRDWLVTNSGARRAVESPEIIFLAIDENTRSLSTLFSDDLEASATLRLMKKGYPWNRGVWANVVDRLADAGARAVILDAVFPIPRDGDDLFRAALERHQDRVVIGTNFIKDDSNQQKLILPIPELRPPEGGPSWLGFVNVFPDEDFLVRRIHFRTTLRELTGTNVGDKDRDLYSLAGRALEKAGLTSRIPPTTKPVAFRFAENLRPYSLHEIFVEAQWNAPPYNQGELFRNKIVLVGATEQASEDRVQTPFGVTIGPQVHLSAINAALNNDFLFETSRRTDVALIVGGGICAWLLGTWIRRPILRLFVLCLVALAYHQVAQHAVNDFGIIPIFFSPVLALTASGITWAAWEQVIDRMERQRTRRALERYVGQDVAHEVLDNPTSYLNALGGQRKEITILFSDVRGFTTLTETADPQALVTQLNEYFEAMVAIVFDHHGTLDKFIGDAVMAHWGSIVSEGTETDAFRAVSTVLKMREALQRLNEGWRARGIKEMHVGFGVNQGDAVVGNLGCEAKMEVSVIGDAVNLGSRLEGVTKKYHIDLCIGENVAALVRNHFILRSVDLIVVVGKSKPVEIFTVLGERIGDQPAWMAAHDEAMKLYRTGRFAEAEAKWREVLAQIPGDGLTGVLLARCALLQREPPEGEWTGVYEMKSK
jgi:adenylate cyclase